MSGNKRMRTPILNIAVFVADSHWDYRCQMVLEGISAKIHFVVDKRPFIIKKHKSMPKRKCDVHILCYRMVHEM